MTLDARARAVASKAIKKYGKTIAYTVVSDATYDVATSEAAATTSARTLKAVVEDVKQSQANNSDSSSVYATKRILVAALDVDFSPSPGDTFTVDGETFTVVEEGVKATYSGELVCIYTMYGKK
jgi:hypothetical protein